jgi:serine/threonine protein kinase
MNSPMTTGGCPTCGAELPLNAPQGLCPKCLMMGVAAPTHAGSPHGQRPAPPEIDAVRAAFPQLEIVELIGQGGMGAVFKARQPKLNRLVALKILPESMARDPAFAERLAREGQLLARLNHHNIVTVHDFGSANGFFYLLMEYVDGVSLRQAMHAGRFTAEQALAIVPLICDALQYAHDEGVLHRDIKPENILLDTKGRVKLVDFGIAKLAGIVDAATAAGPDATAPGDISLTQSGTALGTPGYMAPEQRSDPSTVDSRADIYSLGVVFYEMLTGELPPGNFAPPSSKTPVDPRVDDVVMRAMARQKDHRYRSTTEMRTHLEKIAANPALPEEVPPAVPAAALVFPVPVSRSLRNWLVIGLALVSILVIQSLLSWRPWYTPQWALENLMGDWLQRGVFLAGALGVAWLTIYTWRRRDWLMEPFRRFQPAHARAASRPPHYATFAWDPVLAWAWTGVLLVLGASMLLTVLGWATTAPRLRALPTVDASVGMRVFWGVDFLVLGPVSAILLAIVLARREVRRQATAVPAAAPGWMPRAALLIVALAVVAALPGALQPFLHTPLITPTMWRGEYIVVVALALLTRSRVWRAIALAALTGVAVTNVSYGIAFLLSPGHGATLAEVAYLLSPFSALSISIAALLACAAGFFALLSNTGRAAFGLAPRTRRTDFSPVGTAA